MNRVCPIGMLRSTYSRWRVSLNRSPQRRQISKEGCSIALPCPAVNGGCTSLEDSIDPTKPGYAKVSQEGREGGEVKVTGIKND